MTDTISAELREVAEYAKTDTSSVIWDYPEALSNAADHIDAQDATIKALVDALERVASRHVTESPLWWQVEARTAIDAASPANKSP